MNVQLNTKINTFVFDSSKYCTWGSNTNTSDWLPHATILARGDNTFDYYSFTVDRASAFAIFDIDYGRSSEDFLETHIEVFDERGNLVSYSNGLSSSFGQGGSTSWHDDFEAFDLNEPGIYYVKISKHWKKEIPVGASYILHISIHEHSINYEAGDKTLISD